VEPFLCAVDLSIFERFKFETAGFSLFFFFLSWMKKNEHEGKVGEHLFIVVVTMEDPAIGSTPYSIERAVEELQSRKRRHQCGDSSSNSPIDLVAVILDVVIRNDDDPFTSPFCRLWIRDASLNSNTRCHVLIAGKRKVDVISKELKLRRGNVVRFNRVHLNDRSHDEAWGTHGGDGTVYSFKYFFHDLEAGEDYFRLLHIDKVTATKVDENKVPDSMRTDPKYLEELVAWFQNSGYCLTTKPLPPLTCQFRSLAELQTSQGVESHVVATVLQVETAHRLFSMSKKKKRRRSSVEAPPPTYVTLTDDNGTTVTNLYLDNLCSRHKLFQPILSQANDEKQPVRLSHVVTKKRQLGADEVILLLPTNKTEITLAKDHEIKKQQQRIYNEATQASLLSMTQSQRHLTDANRPMEIQSPLLDIHVNGMSPLARTECLKDPSKLYRLLRSDNDNKNEPRSFASAVILTLQESDGSKRMVVQADGTVVQTLCGGIELEDLLLQNDTNLGAIAVNLFSSLLKERVMLRWTILLESDSQGDEEQDSYRVLSVSLPKL